jgi:aconitate hydratase
VQAEVRANYLMSPPLVVAYALAGRMDISLATEPLGTGRDGREVFLRDIWPSAREVAEVVERSLKAEMFAGSYADVFAGDERWNALRVPGGDRYEWDPGSTYIKRAPYFDGMPPRPPEVGDITGSRVLAWLGDSITTDHISPAGSIRKTGPAGQYLISRGVQPADFNQYGARRGHDEVMVRGTFANVRIRNRLVPGVEGGVSKHLPSGEQGSIYDVAMRYKAEGVPTMVLAGREYGSGSSRDWAAKGPRLQGVRAVIAQSFERIHRSNLVGMGLLPLQFREGESADSLGLTGEEQYDIRGVAAALEGRKEVTVTAREAGGATRSFTAVVRIDTPKEADYYRHGGILEYVLRQLAGLG